MGKSASDIETEINEVLDACEDLRAVGLWFKMKKYINTTFNPGYLERGGACATISQIVDLVGGRHSIERARKLVAALNEKRACDAPLIQTRERDGRQVLFSEPIERIVTLRRLVSDRVKSFRGRNAEPPFPPPQGFPPTTPLPIPTPLSPEISPLAGAKAPGEFGEIPSVTDAHRIAAVEAFDRWSHVYRGHPILAERNEVRVVHEMLDSVAQDPPILRGSEQIPQQALVPRAIDVLMKKSLSFKSIKFACGAVKTELSDWMNEGMPGVNKQASKANRVSPTYTPVTGFKG